ncbi:MAG: GAF domain-containing protein, partial [Myxococcota bacterium]
MQVPPKHPDEARRLAALRDAAVLDTPAEERFDRITRLARYLLNVPIALVSLVDEERQWFKSAHGLETRQTPRDVAFCAHAILSSEPLVVEDAHADPRFADNPLVVGAPGVRFYAGQPLLSPEGLPLGTICVIDQRPRTFGPELREQLTLLGRLAQAELSTGALTDAERQLLDEAAPEDRAAFIDADTLAWSRPAIERLLARQLAHTQSDASDGAGVGVIWVEAPAPAVAPRRELCEYLRRFASEFDSLGVDDDSGFVCVMPGLDAATLHARIASLREHLATADFEHPVDGP